MPPLFRQTFCLRGGSRREAVIALVALVPVGLILGRAAADVLVSLAALLFLADSVLRRDFAWTRPAWIKAALILWIYTVTRAAFIQNDGGVGLFSALTWIRYIVFAAATAYTVLPDARGRVWLMRLTLGAAAFLAADGLFQYVTGKDIIGREPFAQTRLTAVYTRPILGFTIAQLFVAPAFGLLDQKRYGWAAAFTALCLATVFLSGDRMAMVMTAFIVAAWLFFLMRAQKRRLLTAVAALALLASPLALAPAMVERQIQSTLATAEHVQGTPYGLVWKSARDIGIDHPLFGVGMKQFRTACTDERYGPLNAPDTGAGRCYTHPHNPYLEWFAEGGIVGAAGFALFAFFVLRGLCQRVSWRGPLIPWGIGAFMLMRFFPFLVATSFFNNWAAIPFWLTLGWAMSFPPRASQGTSA